jgi:hypothetical protein
MSKRAEELARTLTGLCPEAYECESRIRVETEERLKKAITLIDAELRKEREQCAERFRLAGCPLIFNERTIKPESCQKCTKLLGPQYCTEVAAILKEPEDA